MTIKYGILVIFWHGEVFLSHFLLLLCHCLPRGATAQYMCNYKETMRSYMGRYENLKL
jgi:hypothetical protein